jgi:predicted RNA binding protein YcfA (HicA-like mRNA interferase family)
MSVEKIIQKMKNQPSGVSPDEAGKVLLHYGYTPLRQKGSHRSYRNNKNGDMYVMAVRNPLKRAYVEDILKRIGEK